MRRSSLLLMLAALLLPATAARATDSETFHGIPLPPGAEPAEPATWEPPAGPDEDEWEEVERQAYETGLSVEGLEAFYRREMPKAGWQAVSGDPQREALGTIAWAGIVREKSAQAWIAPVPPDDLPDGENYDLILIWRIVGGELPDS